MAKKTLNAISGIDTLPNLVVRVKKTTGHRRITDFNTGSVGAELAKAESPSAIAAIAMDHGIREDEIVERAKNAPNFGQFRMVLGNRIKAIAARHAADKSISAEDAAYPKEAAKRRREEQRLGRIRAKANAAKNKTETKDARIGSARKKTGKKVGKKTATRRAAPAVAVVIEG